MFSKKVGVSDFVGMPCNLLRLVGIQLFKWHPDDCLSRREKFGLFFLIAGIVVNVPLVLAFPFCGRHETVVLTEYVLYTVFVINSLMKFAALLFFRRKLNIVLSHMTAELPQTLSERMDYKVEACYAKVRRINKYVSVVHWAASFMFSFFPLMQSLVGYLFGSGESGAFVYRLPYMLVYPFDERRPLSYVYAYATQVLGGFLISIFFLSSDLLLIDIVELINMHFRYLRLKIVEFVPTGCAEDIKLLGKLLAYHDRLFVYTEATDEAFSICLLLNYGISCFMICLIGFQIIIGTLLYDIIKFVAFMAGTLTHLLLISVICNDLIDVSEGISLAFYAHSWYLADVRYQRMLPLAMARAQRPAKLTGFKFFVISMESFRTLISTSYQFFTLIRAQLDERA